MDDETPRPRQPLWEENSSDADCEDDTEDPDDEFCVPTTPRNITVQLEIKCPFGNINLFLTVMKQSTVMPAEFRM